MRGTKTKILGTVLVIYHHVRGRKEAWGALRNRLHWALREKKRVKKVFLRKKKK